MPDTIAAPSTHGNEIMRALSDFENPLASEAQRTEAAREVAHVHGEFSIEKFCNVSSLVYTHEDAHGFWEYLNRFYPANFWYRDDGVRAWAYYEDFDNWQDTYGMDAVLAAYHSGHGGMDANGVFYAPMGADWGGLGCTAVSSNMRLGNEHARYIFWSTCLSLRVLEGHSPIRTWSGANLGWRMLFGFETVSWDDPNYGGNFWRIWNENKDKSLGTAWLDASWKIAHDQTPSVVACGASAEEAKNRVFNERNLEWPQVSHDWWHWRWYAAATTSRAANRSLPRDVKLAVLRPVSPEQADPLRLVERFGLGSKGITAQSDGGFSARNGEMHLSLDAHGALAVRLAAPNLENPVPLPVSRARRVAEDAIRQYGLDAGNSLVFDRAIHSASAGGTEKGDGRLESPQVSETIFQFRQVINGMPVISPDAGTVRVAVDNDGRITTLHSALREVDTLSAQARTTPPQPPELGRREGIAPLGPEADDIDALLAPRVGQRLRQLVAAGGNILEVTTVPGTTEVGYNFQNGTGELVARKGIEVDFGGGYRKRYWVQQTLFG